MAQNSSNACFARLWNTQFNPEGSGSLRCNEGKVEQGPRSKVVSAGRNHEIAVDAGRLLARRIAA